MASQIAFRNLGTLLFLLSFVGLGYAGFNCTRSGCYNGGLCELGKCTCMGSSTTGFDCSQRQEYIMQGACLRQNLCHNGGTCFDTMIVGAQKSTGCYCPYETYGEYCEKNSVRTECYADRMIININPGPNFAGIIFVHQPPVMAPMPGFGPSPAAAAPPPPAPAPAPAPGLPPTSPGAQCLIPTVSSQVMFNLDPVRRNWHGYATQLFYNGTMCGVQPNRTVTATEVTFTYEVMVQYDPNKSDPLVDEIISFSCPRPNSAAGPIGPTAVLFSVADGTGAMVRNPKLGSPVTISFSVDPSSIFTDILVQSCTVSSARNGMSKMVVKDSCPVKPFGKSLEKLGHTHVLTLVMHALGRDPNLDFDCAVKVCTVSDPSCQKQPFCPVVHGPPTTGAHHGASPMGADPHAHGGAHGGAAASADILGMMGMGGSGGASALDSLLAGGGTGGAGATGGAGGATVLGGGDTMMLQDLVNSLGGGVGAGAGAGPSATGGSGATAGAAGADFLSSLMNMAGGSGAIGTNVMNDMLFGAPTGSTMGGGGPTGGMMGGSPTGMMGGGMMMGYRRRRSVKEYEEEQAEDEGAASRLSSSSVVRVSGRLPLCE